MVISYPPLPPNDGLRLLTLQPGGFWDPLVGKLESVAFSAKPKYIAVSYTWADPDTEHANIPSMPGMMPHLGPGTIKKADKPNIIIGGLRLRLFHNIALALRFLRSPNHPLALWVDAICIDQSNMDERNAQVALMAFIFNRAAGVISWLGVPQPKLKDIQVIDGGMESYLKRLWAEGVSKTIAGRFRQTGAGQGLFSFTNVPVAPISMWLTSEDLAKTLPLLRQLADDTHMPRVHDNPYWGRLWVIQEVCLPRNLAFMFGSEVWSEALLRQMLAAAERIPGRVIGTDQEAEMTMGKLLHARKERFTDAMRLESLMERFTRSGCADLRDRVFGLAGLANDVDTFATNIPGPQQPPATDGNHAQKRGRGMLQIDYARGFYDIWCDVVSYMHFRAKPMLDFGKEAAELEDERRVRVVRFAGVVQRAFEGKVEKEAREVQKQLDNTAQGADPGATSVTTLARSPGIHQSASEPRGLMSRQRQTIQAKGYVAGKVVHIGPTYRKFVGSYREQQSWIASWDTHYHEALDLEKLRQMEETYSAKILDYSQADLARIRHINNDSTVAWGVLDAAPPPGEKHPVCVSSHAEDLSEPVRFLGSDFCMGLAPAGVEVGDMVVRFWNCDASIIVRGLIHSMPRRSDAVLLYGLVGRADIAELHGQRRGGMDNSGKDAMRVFGLGDGFTPRPGQGPRTKAMYVQLDFETLQLISAGIAL